MNLRAEWKPLFWISAVFLIFYLLPEGSPRVMGALGEAVELAAWYAREHVILCLLTALFIAGAIGVFVGQASVMKYLGAGANRVVAYGVASVSGSVLAVCSCTVLPLFAGIYRMGAGLGPACAFLYSGPAINVLAIILTARILGMEMGVARAVGAILFSVVIGVLMHLLFRKEEAERVNAKALPPDSSARPLWQTASHLAAMIGILIFANWARPQGEGGLWSAVFSAKWWITAGFAFLLAVMTVRWFQAAAWKIALAALPALALAVLIPHQPQAAFAAGVLGFSVVAGTSKGELREWLDSTWSFAKQILPLLFYGVLFSGVALGRPGHEGLIPSYWIASLVGGNSLGANFVASVIGAFMYFATLTEVPIVQGLLGSGMGKGPALALLLSGPALSLPSMLVIRSILGTKKTLAFIALVVLMATITGLIFGAMV
ncbi:MAG: permease [bacterium]|nr:permease [bacterium]